MRIRMRILIRIRIRNPEFKKPPSWDTKNQSIRVKPSLPGAPVWTRDVRLTPPALREYWCWERTCGTGRAYVSSGPEIYLYTGPDPDSYCEMDRIPKVLMSIQGERLLKQGFEAMLLMPWQDRNNLQGRYCSRRSCKHTVPFDQGCGDPLST